MAFFLYRKISGTNQKQFSWQGLTMFYPYDNRGKNYNSLFCYPTDNLSMLDIYKAVKL